MKKIEIISMERKDSISTSFQNIKRKTAAYARVSTDKDEQFTSYESQIDYYTNLINNNPDLEFVKVYTDEGITGTSTKYRKGFNEMIRDALDGKIDLIITKSISRFARNTVDSLIAIRKLKEIGCEIFFEKENIYTFDSKGELLITIMSSLAQEESRSISENVTWGIRKLFSDGKYHIHYSEFLGYDKGENGEPIINELEAITVKRIYLMCLQGLSCYQIAKELTLEQIKTPMNKDTWHTSVIKSILSNEKYIGDAILQKTISTDFLTKKRKENTGEANKYYVKNGHPAIISRSLFDKVQKQLINFTKTRFYDNDKEYSKRIKCGCCGNWFYEAIINKGKKDEKLLWKCNKKNATYSCTSKKYTVDEMKLLFVKAKNELITNPDILYNSLKKLKVSKQIISSTIDEIKEIEKYIKINKNNYLNKRINYLNKNIDNYNKINEIINSKSIEYNELVKVLKKEKIIDKLIDYIVLNDKTKTIYYISNDYLSIK